ncbi:hypothetical protein C8P63_1398 [Melghirimyces profundicolus]|uniref:Uncharacterized protein n=1 Tax=Melghirimyces profundicolus TaxID=1242148 RepID=A0A2T6B1A0_9BACL|nr:hypothetical protein C8P63_1398 [Melghirimyces profundicolus]
MAWQDVAGLLTGVAVLAVLTQVIRLFLDWKQSGMK